jgi:hypothetical protein
MPGRYVICRTGASTKAPGDRVLSTIGCRGRSPTDPQPPAIDDPPRRRAIARREQTNQPTRFHDMSLRSADRTLGPVDVALRLAIVALALSTGYIHSTLGGLLFTLNALGYLTAAVAMVIPLGIAVRFRWFVRLGLIGYAATTIIAWAVQGPYFMTAYIAKAIEVALIALVAIDFARLDGNPITVVKSELALLSSRLGRRSATGSAGA